MKFDYKQIKASARESMSLTSPKFWVVALVYILMTTGVSVAVSVILIPPLSNDTMSSSTPIFFNILFSLYACVVSFGYHLWSLWSHRRLNPGLGTLCQGFSISGRVILMNLFIFLRGFGWILLGFIGAFPLLSIPSVPVNLVVSAILYILFFIIMLRYEMAPYLLADHPDDGPGNAVRRSVALMRGNLWALFRLHLSFILWYLLNFLVTSVVMYIFIMKYQIFTGPVTTYTLMNLVAIINSLPFMLAVNLVLLPLNVFRIPYVSIAQASFYDKLLTATPNEHSQIPPL